MNIHKPNRVIYDVMKINVEPYLEEADENSYLFFLNDISSQFWSHK